MRFKIHPILVDTHTYCKRLYDYKGSLTSGFGGFSHLNLYKLLHTADTHTYIGADRKWPSFKEV